jgi:GT2 family glycosyltransferase
MRLEGQNLENQNLEGPPPVVSIILVNYNGGPVVLDCLASIQAQLRQVPYEVILVDNASGDGSADRIAQQFPDVQLVRSPVNRGFGAGNNVGASLARGQYLFLLNTDTILTADLLPTLVALIGEDPTIGIVGPQLRNPDGSFQLSTSPALGIWGESRALRQQRQYRQQRARLSQQFDRQQLVDIVIGAALLIRTSLFQSLGGFDERFFMYFEESDLCQRARDQGWQIMYTPAVSLIHLGGYSVGKTADGLRLEYRRSQLYYYQKHRPLWEQVILRGYLALKFGWGQNRKIWALVWDFQGYPLRRPSHRRTEIPPL